MSITLRTAALTATLALSAGLLAGCATATAATPDASATGTPTATATPDPYAGVRSLGYGVYRVLDALALAAALGAPRGDSIVEPGASRAIDDGGLLAIADWDYGETIHLQLIDASTSELAEPMGEFVFYATVDDLLTAGLIEEVPRQ